MVIEPDAAEATATAPARFPSRQRLASYTRLAKLDVYDYHLSLLVVWTLLPAGDRFAGRTLAVLLLFGLGTVAVLSAGAAFDDVTGFRDGSDAANYGPDASARRLARKPLLTGALHIADAIRFAWLSAVGGTLGWVFAWLVAPFHPLWTVWFALGCLLGSLQYSHGLKLSHRGGQELILIGFGAGLVLVPYGLLAGHIETLAAVQAGLFGFGPLVFGLYANTNGVAGDPAVRRRTVAALLSPRANAAFIGVLSAAEPVLVIGAAVTGAVPVGLPVAMLPTFLLRTGQARVGLWRGDTLAARRLGIRAHRMTVVALVLVNIVSGWIA